MGPLSDSPNTFAEVVEADVRRAARLIIKVQDEIDWQWRIATPHGDYHIVVTMPTDAVERSVMLQRIEVFMVWRQALGFTMACEIFEPDGVYCVGIAQTKSFACWAKIARTPKPWTAGNFGPVEWLPEASIDPELLALLPRKPRPLSPKDVSALQKWFGVDGKFPAVHIPSGEVRAL